jgi:hypothetical protein
MDSIHSALRRSNREAAESAEYVYDALDAGAKTHSRHAIQRSRVVD